MSFENEQEYNEICVQTNENSMDLYDQLENYFNPHYYLNQEQLLDELYKEPLEDVNLINPDKMYSQSLGNIDDAQPIQGKQQSFNFVQLEKYSEIAQNLKKKPLNIGQMYLQSLEKQAQTLKKIDLKFIVNNNNNNNSNNNQQNNNTTNDENNNINHQTILNKRKVQVGRQQIKSQIIDLDLPIYQNEQSRGSYQSYFQEPVANSYLRLFKQNDDNNTLNQKYYTQLGIQSSKNINGIEQQSSQSYHKLKGYSQHSSIAIQGINNPEDINQIHSNKNNTNNSPFKKLTSIQQKKIRAMTSNQQFRSNFRTVKQTEPNNNNNNNMNNNNNQINQQFNNLKSMFSDFQLEVKQRENNQNNGNVVFLNMENAKKDYQTKNLQQSQYEWNSNKSVTEKQYKISQLINTPPTSQQNLQYIQKQSNISSKIAGNNNNNNNSNNNNQLQNITKLINSQTNSDNRQISSAQQLKGFPNLQELKIGSQYQQDSLPSSLQNISVKKSMKQVQFLNIDKEQSIRESNNNNNNNNTNNHHSISCQN